MKRSALIFFGVLITLVTGLLQSSSPLAKNKPNAEEVPVLKEIETLFFISQDLDDNTALHISPKDGCYCSCRDLTWSCTDVNCKMHMKECENPPAAEHVNDQSRVTPPAYQATVTEENAPEVIFTAETKPAKAMLQNHAVTPATARPAPTPMTSTLSATLPTATTPHTQPTSAYSGIKTNSVAPASDPTGRYAPESLNW